MSLTHYVRIRVTTWGGKQESEFVSKIRWPHRDQAAAHAARLRRVYDSKFFGIHWAEDDRSGEEFGVDPHGRNVEIAVMSTVEDEPSRFLPVLVAS